MKACPLCESRHWAIEDIVVMLKVGPQGPELGRGLPVVPIVCAGCGHTTLVSATALKFISPEHRPQRS
jgi:hypothetical protein